MRRKTACAYDFRVRVTTFGNALGSSIVGAIENTPGQTQAANANAQAAPSLFGANPFFSGGNFATGQGFSLGVNTDLSGATAGLDTLPGVSLTAPDLSAGINFTAASPNTYTVQSGDTLSGILGTSDPTAIGAFMRANGLTSSTIHPGDQLTLTSGGYSSSDTALGQATLNQDNVRLAALNAPSPTAGGVPYYLDPNSAGAPLSPAPLATGTIGPDPGLVSNLGAIGNAFFNGNLSAGDALSMALGQVGYGYRGSDTAQGLVQIAGGTGEVAGAIGITASTGGVGAIVGVPLAFHGGDDIGTGLNRIIYGEPQQTATYTGVYAATGSASIAQGVDVGIPLVLGAAAGGAGLVDGLAPVSASTAVNSANQEMVMVYRGTNRVLENQVYDETGHVLSDAGVRTYAETGDLQAAYNTAENVHGQAIELWGDENTYAQAHGEFGTELSRELGLDRTFVSVTTDPSVAGYFAGENGVVYSGLVPRSSLVPQTLPGAGENEFLLRYGTNSLAPASH